MLEIAVCSGDEAARARVAEVLREWARMACADIAPACFCGAEEFLQAYAPGKYPFLFLDTALEGRAGLDIARHVRAAGDNCQIAFLSGDARHALACYEAHPAGFFLKPPERERLLELLHWHRAVFLSAMRSLTVVSARVSRRILLADIFYVAVSGRTSIIHLKKEEVPTNRTLSALAAELEGMGFFRCHRGYLVNGGHVAAMEARGIRLDDGREIPVSEDRAAATREWAKGCARQKNHNL